MNNETVDKIMDVVCPICHHYQNKRVDRLNGACPPCPFRDAIAAILAEPQVIVKDGVVWKANSFISAPHNGRSGIVRQTGDDWEFLVVAIPGMDDVRDGKEYTGPAALSAATAAIKEEGQNG